MTEARPDILIVEDNQTDVEFMLDALRECGLAQRVKVLRDGEEAVRYLFGVQEETDEPDERELSSPRLVLLDLNLPKIDGLEVLKRIRSEERTRTFPVVVLTSSLMEGDRIESYNLGANSFIVKPVDFVRFHDTVTRIGCYWALVNESAQRPDRWAGGR